MCLFGVELRVIGMAVLGNLPGLWPLLAGATGAIMFFAAGPT